MNLNALVGLGLGNGDIAKRNNIGLGVLEEKSRLEAIKLRVKAAVAGRDIVERNVDRSRCGI
jgi:hypothetical protein